MKSEFFSAPDIRVNLFMVYLENGLASWENTACQLVLVAQLLIGSTQVECALWKRSVCDVTWADASQESSQSQMVVEFSQNFTSSMPSCGLFHTHFHWRDISRSLCNKTALNLDLDFSYNVSAKGYPQIKGGMRYPDTHHGKEGSWKVITLI